MKFVGCLRAGGLALALLAAALLMAPLLHCTLLDADEHSHATAQHSHESASPITALGASTVAAPSRAIADTDGRYGVPHDIHCFVNPALPVGGGSLAPLLLVLFVLAAAIVVATVHWAGSGGIRGPPVAAVPAVSGRVLLTHLCIARR
ncbi:hypothetical protein [Nocardia sp. NPDC052112]|uniref:hypothetical protein n=1 Tax=Nocardia sp. NPDC052112 TaxID=3155646 RepID=UPI003425B013